MNDFILMAVDEHGATSTHEFQVHVFNESQYATDTKYRLAINAYFCWRCVCLGDVTDLDLLSTSLKNSALFSSSTLMPIARIL